MLLYVLYLIIPLTVLLTVFWIFDQLFLAWYEKKPDHPVIKFINRYLPFLILVSIFGLFRLKKYQFDFDFNWILVPITLFLVGIVIADKFYYRDRKNKGKGNERALINWAYDFYPVLLVVVVVRSFIVEPFNIPSSSMRPSLFTGDFILVNKFDYGIRLPLVHNKVIPTGEPKRGDVVVFRFPENPSIYFIKRTIGLPGDIISYRDGTLSINGKALKKEEHTNFQYDKSIDNAELDYTTIYNETIDGKTHLVRDLDGISAEHKAEFLHAQNPNILPMNLTKEWTVKVPEGNYFMMGDNRDESADSRFWGFVPEANISGKAFYVWMHKEAGLKLPSFSQARKIQ